MSIMEHDHTTLSEIINEADEYEKHNLTGMCHTFPQAENVKLQDYLTSIVDYLARSQEDAGSKALRIAWSQVQQIIEYAPERVQGSPPAASKQMIPVIASLNPVTGLTTCFYQLQFYSSLLAVRKQPTRTRVIVNPLRKFTCFKQLPTELRAMIWKHAFPEHQAIELYRTPDSLHNGKMAYVARQTLKTLLFTCKESSGVVKLHYKQMSFEDGTFDNGTTVTTRMENPLLVSPQRDAVYLTAADQVFMYMSAKQRIQQLALFHTIAIPAATLMYYLQGTQESSFMEWIPKLTNLKAVIVVCRESREEHGSEVTFKPFGLRCKHTKALEKRWEIMMEALGRDIKLAWVQCYRDGALANVNTIIKIKY